MEFILQGLAIGLAAGTSFGPLHTLLMNITLSLGWRQGLLIVLSPLITDIPIIILMLFILDQLPATIIPIIQIVGGLVIFGIAWNLWKQLRKGDLDLTHSESLDADLSRETLLKGVMVNFLNPAPYIFWGTVNGPLFLAGLEESVFAGFGFILCFYGSFLGIMAVFVVVFERLRGIDQRFTNALMVVSIVILIALGANILLQGVQGLG